MPSREVAEARKLMWPYSKLSSVTDSGSLEKETLEPKLTGGKG